MDILTSLLTLIVVARLLGHLAERLGQPAVVGEMVAGVLVGPAVFGLVEASPALSGIASLAIFLVILATGLEMNVRDLLRALTGRGALLALAGFVLPFAGGVAVGLAFALDPMRTIFLGLCISITALPVAVKILDDLGLIGTPIASFAISTAIVNDVIALFVLGVILALPPQMEWSQVITAGSISMAKLAALIGLVLGLSQLLKLLHQRGVNIARLPEWLVGVFGPDALFGIVVVFVMVFGSISGALGFHFVIGAFFGALLIDRQHFVAARYEDLKRTIGSVTSGFLAPVFLASLGLEFKFPSLDYLPFVITVVAVSILTKVAAGWWGGRQIGLGRREALGLGCILNGRGVMELVIASIAYQRGFIGPNLFSALVLMGIVTTLLTPVLFNWAMPSAARQRYAAAHRRTDDPPMPFDADASKHPD